MKLSHWASMALLGGLLALTSLGIVHAQGAQTAYILAADSGGVVQVYQLQVGAQSAARQITHADRDVLSFGGAYDGLSIAYASGGQLWLQPIHTDSPQSLASLSTPSANANPVFSPDGQYLAYADGGVWLLDLGTRQTRQLLRDVPLRANASNAGLYRLYRPERFIPGTNGSAAKLIVDVGIWEWNTVGVVDLASGDLQELAGQLHTSLLSLGDGRVLLYGNTGVGGEMSLDIATSLDDINTSTRLVDFGVVSQATLFADQAVEVAPRVVRIFGSSLGADSAQPVLFSFDYDLSSSTASAVHFFYPPQSAGGSTVAGEPSPDGSLIPVYVDAQTNAAGVYFGQVTLYDPVSGDPVPVDLPSPVGLFRWQP